MLSEAMLNRVLNVYNDVISEPRLTLDELRLHVRRGTIGPPEVLEEPNQLLNALFRYAYEQRAAKFPVAPPAWEQRHRGVRWTIEEWPQAPSAYPAGARVVAEDPFTETTLVAIQQPELVEYTGRDIFNEFFALDLQCSPTSVYPSPSDRDKIVTFLAYYGPNFLPYPCADRAPEDQLDYFSEFNRQYQTFSHAVRYLAKPPAPPPVLPRDGHGSTPYDSVDNALTNLNDGLDQIKPRLRRLPDGTVVTAFEPTYGLYLCYVTLWGAMSSYQPPFRFCALPSCQRPFIPHRKDQPCCTREHANHFRVDRHRHTR